MQVANRKQYEYLSFEEYLKLPGLGFSGIRNPDGVQPTSKMRFGSLVDNYLFTPKEYTGEQIELVRPVALQLRSILGTALLHGKPQLSVTADFVHDGMSMPYRGRPDLVLKSLVIDLKVSQLDTIKAIKFFRYDWQLSGYCAALGINKAIICSINPKNFKVTLIPINPVFDWWQHQIKIYGQPCNMPTL